MNLPAVFATVRADADARLGDAAGELGARLCAEAPRLRRLAHRLLGWRARGDELDDVVQEALLKAWRHRAAFRGEASLATWLTRIVVHTCHDHARRRRLRQRLFGWLLPAHDEPMAPAPAAPDDAPHAATRLAMQRLAHADREVLVLRYLEQRDIEDMARLLQLSRAAVDARLSRARQRLRRELGLEARP